MTSKQLHCNEADWLLKTAGSFVVQEGPILYLRRKIATACVTGSHFSGPSQPSGSPSLDVVVLVHHSHFQNMISVYFHLLFFLNMQGFTFVAR